MGQILFRQPKKPLNKGFFMYSYMPPTEIVGDMLLRCS